MGCHRSPDRRRLHAVADRNDWDSSLIVESNSMVQPTTAFEFAHRSVTTLPTMPSDFSLKAMNRVHRVLLGASGGRLGWHFSGMPVLELTTTGRKSGQPRTTMLTSPFQEDATIVVVASRGGDDTNPAWFLNLRDDPNVTVRLRASADRRACMDTGDASRRQFGFVTRVNVRITETTFPLVRAYPRGLLAQNPPSRWSLRLPTPTSEHGSGR